MKFYHYLVIFIIIAMILTMYLVLSCDLFLAPLRYTQDDIKTSSSDSSSSSNCSSYAVWDEFSWDFACWQ